MATLFGLSLLGPLAAGIGYGVLRKNEPVTAALMSFSAGVILYLIFQDISPAAARAGHWKAPMGAVLGFLFGMLGTQLLG